MRYAISIGCLVSCLAVILGAFCAHGLKSRLSVYELEIFETGVRYQFYHGIALVLCGMISNIKNEVDIFWPFVLFAFGILAFSGSLYGLALGMPRWLGPITPIGGMAFIAGWLVLAFKAM